MKKDYNEWYDHKKIKVEKFLEDVQIPTSMKEEIKKNLLSPSYFEKEALRRELNRLWIALWILSLGFLIGAIRFHFLRV